MAGSTTLVPTPEQGIAIIGANQNNGTWQYSTSDGSVWSNFGATSSKSALLLASDLATRLRFLPKKNFNGSVGFTFLAWDQTSGSNGTTASTAVRGGVSAFSLARIRLWLWSRR